MDMVGMIIEYENGDLSDGDTLEFFAALVASGLAWSLQGHYGRMAVSLIDGGLITPDGEVTEYGRGLVE